MSGGHKSIHPGTEAWVKTIPQLLPLNCKLILSHKFLTPAKRTANLEAAHPIGVPQTSYDVPFSIKYSVCIIQNSRVQMLRVNSSIKDVLSIYGLHNSKVNFLLLEKQCLITLLSVCVKGG
jgi:hypothetical protein